MQYPHSDLRAQLQATGIFELHIPFPHVSVRRRVALAGGALLAVAFLSLYLGLILFLSWIVHDYVSGPGPLRWIFSNSPTPVASWAFWLCGCLLILSLLKALVARPGRAAVPHRLNPDSQPLLFAFVHELAARSHMPEPAKIAVDWNVNCCCVFAGGASAIFRPELQLVIGLPVVAGLPLDQFAGVLAHELHHAAQITASKSSRFLSSIHAWFSRVALEQDAFDERILAWLETANGMKRFLLHCIQGLVVPGRAVVRLIMLAETAVSSVFLRGMEREADGCQTWVAGTEGFLSTLREINFLSIAVQRAIVELSRMWREGYLTDNYPRLVVSLRGAYSNVFVQHLQAGMEERRTGMFSIHPCDRDRMAFARTQATAGSLITGVPATTLFADFDELCRQVTLEYYDQDLRVTPEACELVPFQHSAKHQESGSAARSEG